MNETKKRGGAGAYKRRVKHAATCEQCRGVFYTTRADAKTCSDRCRKRMSRGSGLEATVSYRTITFNMGKKGREELVVPMDRYWSKVTK